MAWRWESVARASTSGSSKAQAISAPVFNRCIRATPPRSSRTPRMSIIWPPAMPLAPDACARPQPHHQLGANRPVRVGVGMGEDLEGGGLQGVPGQDGGRLVIGLVR